MTRSVPRLGRTFREKTVSACSHSERVLIAVNGLLQVFRQDHLRAMRSEASACNVPCHRYGAAAGGVEDKYGAKEKTIRNQKRVCR